MIHQVIDIGPRKDPFSAPEQKYEYSESERRRKHFSIFHKKYSLIKNNPPDSLSEGRLKK